MLQLLHVGTQAYMCVLFSIHGVKSNALKPISIIRRVQALLARTILQPHRLCIAAVALIIKLFLPERLLKMQPSTMPWRFDP